MKRLALGIAVAALVASPAQAERRRNPPAGAGTANPSALIAEEIAFARAARDKGQWSAFRDFADESAILFVPQRVVAKDWLKRQKDPAAPAQWQTHQVWMSCDGSLGVTKGAWQRPDGSKGWFTAIWKRQKKGEYRWVLDHGHALGKALPAPDMISAKVASCSGAKPTGAPADATGKSLDGTLTWSVSGAPGDDGAQKLTVQLWNGAQYAPIAQDTIGPPR